MADYKIQDTTLKAIADSIRSKTGSTEGLYPTEMASAIDGITVGADYDIIEDLEIDLNLSDGNQTLYAPNGSLVKSAIIKKPDTLIPENIAEGINIAGVIGTFKGSGSGNVEGFATVTFMNGNEVIYTRPVYIGDDCPDPVTQGRIETPTKESTAQYNYTHNGWASVDGGTANSNVLKNIQADTVVYSAYKESVRYYTITYFDEDGTTVLHTEQLAYGDMPSYVPTHPTDPDGYVFDSWNPTITEVTSDMNYVVVWRERKALADFTWEQLNDMSIEDIRANFRIGEQKSLVDGDTSKGMATLIGIEHDDLSDGSGKARMTFALKFMPYVYNSSLGGYKKAWGNTDTGWGDTLLNPTNYYNKYGNYNLLDSTLMGDVHPFVKTVKKKYNTTDFPYSYSYSNDTYFLLSIAEMGYSFQSDGDKYEYFTNKGISGLFETNNVTYPENWCYTRTMQGSGSAYCVQYNKAPDFYSMTGSSNRRYWTCGFCI